MIAQLEGEVVHLGDGAVILEVGGVGFAIYVPTTLQLQLGDRVVLHTHLQVRENELALYGFAEPDDKWLFETLVGVSGVGPKAALSLMSTMSADTLRRAIVNGQPEVLSRAPGVGKKTGESIVLHLRDRLKRSIGSVLEVREDDADVIAALTGLGFSIVEAQRALQQLPRDRDLSLDDKIRQALVLLGR